MAYALILFYLVAIVSPFFALGIHGLHSDETFFTEVGRCFGMFGFMILMLQVVLAGRFKSLTKYFGLDIVLRFHRNMAILALVFLLVHPLFLALGDRSWAMLSIHNLPWNIWLGKFCLVLLLVIVLVSKFQLKWKIKFEKWRWGHNLAAPALLIGIFIHSFVTGDDLDFLPTQTWWFIILLGALALFVYHRMIRPSMLWRRPYQVADIKSETDNVWTVKMTPPVGEKTNEFLPGQFHFLTFKSSGGVPPEEHHFTISSSPANRHYVTSTIKALGDFTSQIGSLRPGDRVRIQAPFGRFSYPLYPEEKELVFLTGGIGITPLMSMLRHMRDTERTIPVTLFYANRAEEDIVFKEELDALEADEHFRLKVVHILSHPAEGWNGESGHLSKDMIQRHLDSPQGERGYYLCGPKALVKAAEEILRDMGVSDRRLHTEIFSFLD